MLVIRASTMRYNYQCPEGLDPVLMRFQTTFLALVSYPLSLRERVRVRAFIRAPWGPSPPALSRWEREREAPPAMPKEVA